MGAQTFILTFGGGLLVLGILSAVGGSPAGALLIILTAVGIPIALILTAAWRFGGQSSITTPIIKNLLWPPSSTKLSPTGERAESTALEESVRQMLAAKHQPTTRPSPSPPTKRAAPSPLRDAVIETKDLEDAWKLISSWQAPSSRASQFDALKLSDRRPYVVLAMIRLAAILANAAGAQESLSGQLSSNSYNNMEMDEGILAATDAIMSGLSKSDLLATEEILPTFIAGEQIAKAMSQQERTSGS